MKKKGIEIANEENVKMSDDAIDSLTRCAEGDMRKLINTLQATHLAFDEVNETNVYVVFERGVRAWCSSVVFECGVR